MRTRTALLVAGGLAGCGLALILVAFIGGGSGSSAGNPYAYDSAAPFHETDRLLRNTRIPVRVHNISFSDARGGEVHAYVCVPRRGKGPFPGVVMVPGSFGRQADFLVECIQFAARGAVAMSMVTPFIHGSQSGPTAAIPGARFYLRHFEDNVVAIRRAFDLLGHRFDVNRIALAGYSLGAALSSVVSGIDSRPTAVGLVAPPSHAHFIPPLRGRTKVEAYRILAPVDPKVYLRRAKAHLFLEMARYDQIEIRPEQRAVITAAGAGARVRWYPTGHEMDVQAWADLEDWLATQLKLGALPSYGQVPA